MRYRLLFLLITCSLALTAQTFSIAKNPKEIKSFLEKKHQSIKSLEANFIEYTHNSMVSQVRQLPGKIYYKQPDQLRWQLLEGGEKPCLLVNGSVVKMYSKGKLDNSPSTKKVASKIQKMTIGMLSGEFLNEKDFSISYFENSKSYQLVLVPKSPKMGKYIQSLELVFDRKSGSIERMIMSESSTNFVRYEYSNQQINQPIAGTKFMKL